MSDLNSLLEQAKAVQTSHRAVLEGIAAREEQIRELLGEMKMLADSADIILDLDGLISHANSLNETDNDWYSSSC